MPPQPQNSGKAPDKDKEQESGAEKKAPESSSEVMTLTKDQIAEMVSAGVQKALDERKVAPAKPIPDNGMQEQVLAASRKGPQPAASLLVKDEETTLMTFPRKVLLTLHDHSRVEFGAGTQPVPNSLVDHFYLKANGVKLFMPPKRREDDAT